MICSGLSGMENPLSTSVIELEHQALLNLSTKLFIKTREGPEALQRVITALQKHLKHEQSKTKNLDNMLKAKRQVYLARQQELLDQFVGEIERIKFGISDSRSTLMNCYYNKQFCDAKIIKYKQFIEKNITNQKEKLILRLTGFAKSIVDSLYEEKPLNTTGKLRNIFVYKLNYAIKMIISASMWPKSYYLRDMLDDVQDPIVLLNSLQLLDISCRKYKISSLSPRGNETLNAVELLKTFRFVIAISFCYIRDWKGDATVIMTIFSQALKCLKAVHHFRYSALLSMEASHHPPATAEHESTTSSSSSSSKKKKVMVHPQIVPTSSSSLFWDWNHLDYSDVTLSADLILWTRAITALSVVPFNPFTIVCSQKGVSFFPETALHPSSPVCTLISFFCSMGQSLLCDLITCSSRHADHLLTLSKQSIHEDANSHGYSHHLQHEFIKHHQLIAEELLSSTLSLALQSSDRYAIRLGSVDCSFCIATGDVAFFRAVDEECVAAFECASVAFAHELASEEATRILRDGQIICRHRQHSFFLVSAWLKCLFAASLFALNHPEERTALEVRDILSGSSFQVMALMFLHRQSLSVARTGMMIIRVICRDSIQKRHVTENLCERSLLAFTRPLTEYSASAVNEEDAKADEEFARLTTSSNTATGDEKKGEEAIGEGHNSGDKMMVDSPLEAWKKENFLKALNGEGGIIQQDYKFADLLHYIGETHIQSVEVVEQLLLLIDQLSFQSQLCKYLIIDSGMPRLLQRMLVLYSTNDLYIAALVELVVSLLDV